MGVLGEEWETPPVAGDAPASYLMALHTKLRANLAQLAQAELAHTQEAQRQCYDEAVRPRACQPGQHILLLLPSSSNKLLMSWQGPFEVVEKVGDVDDRIQVPDQGWRLYHVNLLKEWQEHEDPVLYKVEIDWDEEGKLQYRELQAQIATGEPASAWQQHQIRKIRIRQVLNEFGDVFRQPRDGLGGKAPPPPPWDG